MDCNPVQQLQQRYREAMTFLDRFLFARNLVDILEKESGQEWLDSLRLERMGQIIAEWEAEDARADSQAANQEELNDAARVLMPERG